MGKSKMTHKAKFKVAYLEDGSTTTRLTVIELADILSKMTIEQAEQTVAEVNKLNDIYALVGINWNVTENKNENKQKTTTESSSKITNETSGVKNKSREVKKRSVSKSQRESSDGSSADYYKLPQGVTELIDCINQRNMNLNIGTIFSECWRYGLAEHCDELRGAKKMKFYIEAEIKRLENMGD
jgi:hypothetical protein